MFNYYDKCMNDVIVYEYDIVNEFDEHVISGKSRASLVRSADGWVARHVLQYRQVSSGIEGRRRFDHTINWKFWPNVLAYGNI
ncbi:Tyrosine-protein kinase Blk [Gossypium arboreum]|uniref:Tyrosine-protein kinase Blk n=1 Tax=Gossypium arboreum TaxID=29729 RepID=A0A0B0NXU3_GOSAR|nr:Tyrosine-protein kinase Blk [Gossypium arboreum]